jgi:hypothetical protein
VQELGRNNEPVWRYDLEEEEFVYKIISMAQPVHLWDGTSLTYADLLRDNPHRAYVIAIEYRALIIVDRFKSLNVLDRMFAYDGFPIATTDGSIFRDDWIRITLDVLLSRLTSIRDCCFLFIAEIYELGLDPRRVNLETLKKGIGDARVLALLTDIAATARSIRDERDRHVHRGEERTLAGELDQFFELVARSEGSEGSSPRLAFVEPDGGTQPVEINFSEMHAKIIANVRSEYHREGDLLIKLTRELFVAANSEFERRWAKKRDNSALVRSWERSPETESSGDGR